MNTDLAWIILVLSLFVMFVVIPIYENHFRPEIRIIKKIIGKRPHVYDGIHKIVIHGNGVIRLPNTTVVHNDKVVIELGDYEMDRLLTWTNRKYVKQEAKAMRARQKEVLKELSRK